MRQIAVTIQVIVKAADEDDARRIVERRMVEWFTDAQYEAVPGGEGYPRGSLLYYHVVQPPYASAVRP